MANKENVQLLIDIMKHSNTFSMHAYNWGKPEDEREYLQGREVSCGTCCCLLGHYNAEMLWDGDNPGGIENIKDFASFLEISLDEAQILTHPDNEKADYCALPDDPLYVDKKRMVETLEGLKKTGNVHWSVPIKGKELEEVWG